jgi:small subunit ribosomal protein S3
MGQKVHPVGLRLGVTKKPDSLWMAGKSKNFVKLMQEDLWLRKFIRRFFSAVRISHLHVKRAETRTYIIIAIFSFIGLKITKDVRKDLQTKLTARRLHYGDITFATNSIVEPKLSALHMAKFIANAIYERKSFKFAIKKVIQATKKKVSKKRLWRQLRGLRIQISGRLNGAEMARTYWVRDGQVPLHTLKANIDYLSYPIHTRYGILGLKIWVCNK